MNDVELALKRIDEERASPEFWNEQYNWYIKEKEECEKIAKDIIENHKVMELNRLAAAYCNLKNSFIDRSNY